MAVDRTSRSIVLVMSIARRIAVFQPPVAVRSFLLTGQDQRSHRPRTPCWRSTLVAGLAGSATGLAVGMGVMACAPAVGVASVGDRTPDEAVAGRTTPSRQAVAGTVAAVLAPAAGAEPASARESEDAPP